jgi:hypothetical protein
MRILIREPPECVSRSETLVEMQNFAPNLSRKQKLFAKTIPGTKFVCTLTKIFAKTFSKTNIFVKPFVKTKMFAKTKNFSK